MTSSSVIEEKDPEGANGRLAVAVDDIESMVAMPSASKPCTYIGQISGIHFHNRSLGGHCLSNMLSELLFYKNLVQVYLHVLIPVKVYSCLHVFVLRGLRSKCLCVTLFSQLMFPCLTIL